MVILSLGTRHDLSVINKPITRPMQIWIIEDKTRTQRRTFKSIIPADLMEEMEQRKHFNKPLTIEHLLKNAVRWKSRQREGRPVPLRAIPGGNHPKDTLVATREYLFMTTILKIIPKISCFRNNRSAPKRK